MLTVILPASHVNHFFGGVSDPYSQAEEENTVFEALDCKPWGAVGYAPEGWFELRVPSEGELGVSLGDCVRGLKDAGNKEGSTIPADTHSSGAMAIRTSIMPVEATCSPDDLDTDTNTKGLGSEPSSETRPFTTTDNTSNNNIEQPSTALTSESSKWPPTGLPSFLIDSPASWDGNHAHPEDVYLAAYDDGTHLFVPMVGIFGKLDKEWERRFFPRMAEEAGACATTREGDEDGEGGEGGGFDGVVNVRGGANEKN